MEQKRKKGEWRTKYHLTVKNLGVRQEPAPTAPLRDQRAYIRALLTVYPAAEVTLQSSVNDPRKGVVVRPLKLGKGLPAGARS